MAMSSMAFLDSISVVDAEELFPNFRKAKLHSPSFSFLPSFLRHSKFRKFLIAPTVGPTVNTDIN